MYIDRFFNYLFLKKVSVNKLKVLLWQTMASLSPLLDFISFVELRIIKRFVLCDSVQVVFCILFKAVCLVGFVDSSLVTYSHSIWDSRNLSTKCRSQLVNFFSDLLS